MQKLPTTVKGLKKLEEERNRLKSTDRLNVIKAISAARDLGDLSENAEYHAAREQQAFIEGRILELDSIIARAESIDPTSIKSDKIIFGATVELEDLDNSDKKIYQIVGEFEADIEQGLISYISPLGKALIGKKIGEIITLNIANSQKTWEVLSIKYI